ncbi:hypothetical protein GPALN_005102 [Globodera pallida]|nr:hypothetical protein GPALN_005102 [Globodera pallida]
MFNGRRQTSLKQLVIPVSARLTVSATSAGAFETSNKSSADNEEKDSQGTGGEMQKFSQFNFVFGAFGRKKRSPNGDSSESSSDTSGESNGVPPEV